jgi:hypothetical protein
VDEGLLVDPDARVFHVFNTAQADGKMGVFINKDEKYPNTDCWAIFNDNGLEIGSYRNRPVTHHTFPSWQRLLDFNINNNLYQVNDVSKLTLLASSIGDSDTDGSFPSGLIDLNTQTAITGTWNANGNEFTATEDMSFYLRVLYLLVNAPSDSTPSGQLIIDKYQGVNKIETIVLKIYDGSTFFNDEVHEEIKLNQGETLKIHFITNDSCEGLIEIYLINKQISDVDITSKKLGVKLTNFTPPLEFLENIEWWSLGYAERSNINITRSGQVLMIPDTRKVFEMGETTEPLLFVESAVIGYGVEGYDAIATKSFRTHNFDHLYFKDNIAVDFISGNLKLGTANTYDFHNYISPFVNSNILVRSVKSSYLVPENLVSENNRIGELHHKIKLNRTETFGLQKYQFLMADLCHFRKNLYLNFGEQNVIVSDKKYPVSETETDNLYQGDVFINIQGIGVSYLGGITNGNSLFYLVGAGEKKSSSNKVQDNLLYISESVANVGFRYKDELESSRYYPKFISKQISALYKQTDADKRLHDIGPISPGLLYNSDFNSVNNIKEIQIFKCLEDCESEITRFPVRIARSPKISDESVYNSWRRFRPNDYYDGLPKDRGQGWVLTTFNRSLLIQLQEALYVALPKDIIQSDSIYAYLGSGDLFDRLPEEVVPDGSGYVGCISKWSTGVCKHGYFVWDSVQGKFFIFNGQIDEISNQGLREYLRDLSVIGNEQDNPLSNRGLTVGYDERYNRLLITKIFRKNNVIDNTNSQTLSYSFNNKGWVCTHHDYIPSIYLYARNKFYSIDNNTSTNSFKLYQHNVNTKVCVYYNNVRYASYIDVVFNNFQDCTWQSIQWLSDFITTNGTTFENTISHIMVYTDHHTTGLIALDKLLNLFKTENNTRRKNYKWSFNRLRDVISNKNIAPVLSDGSINTGNINNNLPFFKKNYIINPFIVVRFYIDAVITNKIHINEIFAEFTEYQT